MPGKTVAEWVNELQTRGRYTFLRQDAISGSGLSPEAVKKALQRLTRRNRVAKVKEYFYVIVPLEYLGAGAPPPSWFVADLMAAMKLPYYVGLLSAAALHGAAHQQPQEFQVMTTRSVRPIQVGRARLRFVVNRKLDGTPLVNIKTPTGAVRVSSPEATAVDLVRFVRVAGHLDHVAMVISELIPRMNPRKLLEVVRRADDLPNTQRLGYVLDHVRARDLAKPLLPWVRQRRPRPVPLHIGLPSSDAAPDARWQVIVSQPLEIEV